MALNFFSPVRRTGLALVAGLLLFAVLAAATVNNGDKIAVGDLSVAEIEDKLQVIAPQASKHL
jgi:zinc transporter 7